MDLRPNEVEAEAICEESSARITTAITSFANGRISMGAGRQARSRKNPQGVCGVPGAELHVGILPVPVYKGNSAAAAKRKTPLLAECFAHMAAMKRATRLSFKQVDG